jgi:hypothetical protein
MRTAREHRDTEPTPTSLRRESALREHAAKMRRVSARDARETARKLWWVRRRELLSEKFVITSFAEVK